MPELQAIVEFANVQFVESCSFTLSHGITPGQAILRILPQPANIEKSGTLRLLFGDTKVIFPDCLADNASYQFNQSGEVVSLTVLDRRWAWRSKTINGHYNFKDANGSIWKDTTTGQKPDKKKTLSDCERTPKELIELCLKALDETGYTIKDVPADLRPEVHWDEAYAAIELQRLCDMCGVRVILTTKNAVSIEGVGKGKPLPTGPVEDFNAAIDPADKPKEIAIVGAPNWYQVDLELEAVGIQKNGEIKKIDDLDYKPTTGWYSVDPQMLEDVTGDQDRICARESVYRWYRVKLDGSNKVKTEDGPIEIKLHRQLDLKSDQVFTRKFQGHVEHYPAIVYGDWYDTDVGNNVTDDLKKQNVQDFDLTRSVVPGGYSVDADKLLVKFSNPVWKENSSNQALPAVLKLRCAVQLRYDDTGEFHPYRTYRELDKKSLSGTRVYVHPELRMFYDSKGKPINDKELDALGKKYLDAYEKEYTLDTAESARYAGWIEVTPDGALQSITWSMDQSGATTTVQRNDDRGSQTTNPYKLRRLYERYNESVLKSAKADKETHREWNKEQGKTETVHHFTIGIGGIF